MTEEELKIALNDLYDRYPDQPSINPYLERASSMRQEFLDLKYDAKEISTQRWNEIVNQVCESRKSA